METLPLTLEEPQVMKEHFAFELINPNKHRQFLESCFTDESDIQKAIASWSFSGVIAPQHYKMTRVIKRLSDNEYVCYSDGLLSPITDTTWKLTNGGRIMPSHLRNRGDLTKAIADEGIDYFFQRFPYYVEKIEVQLPPNFDMSKRATKSPDITQTYGSGSNDYSRITWNRDEYLASLIN